MTLFPLRIWRGTLVVARNTEISRSFGVFTAMLRKEDVASMSKPSEERLNQVRIQWVFKVF